MILTGSREIQVQRDPIVKNYNDLSSEKKATASDQADTGGLDNVQIEDDLAVRTVPISLICIFKSCSYLQNPLVYTPYVETKYSA